jgi:ubiquitin-like 1-activating enzyme E1 A
LKESDLQMALNDQCRSLSLPFYCAGTHGLNGWIFSDLGSVHDYVIERPGVKAPLPASTSVADVPKNEQNGSAALQDEAKPTEEVAGTVAEASSSNSAKKLEKRQQKFVPLSKALETSWKGLSRPQQRRNRPSAGLFGVWSLWEHIEAQEDVGLPKASDLMSIAQKIITERGVDPKTIFESQGVDAETYFSALETSISQAGEFSPTCAILGGVLSQDVLNALGGREEPLVNWFQLEGFTGEIDERW